MLTDRELKMDAIKNRPDCTIVERADAPTAEQIAVIWVSEEGLAPDVRGMLCFVYIILYTYSGIWIKDHAGRMMEMNNSMPQLNAACFPILYPKSTPGWRWFMKKRSKEKVKKNF